MPEGTAAWKQIMMIVSCMCSARIKKEDKKRKRKLIAVKAFTVWCSFIYIQKKYGDWMGVLSQGGMIREKEVLGEVFFTWSLSLEWKVDNKARTKVLKSKLWNI